MVTAVSTGRRGGNNATLYDFLRLFENPPENNGFFRRSTDNELRGVYEEESRGRARVYICFNMCEK